MLSAFFDLLSLFSPLICFYFFIVFILIYSKEYRNYIQTWASAYSGLQTLPKIEKPILEENGTPMEYQCNFFLEKHHEQKNKYV